MPDGKKETLELYCKNLSEQIDSTKPFSLVGLSFGGVIATEMSKFLKPVQTILISSFCFKTGSALKFYVSFLNTGLYKLLPTRIFLKPNHFVFRIFGAYNPAAKNYSDIF